MWIDSLKISENDLIGALFHLQETGHIDLKNVTRSPDGKFQVIDNKITANKKEDYTQAITFHTHNDYRSWWKKPETLRDLVKFLRVCSPEDYLSIEKAIQK